MTDSPYSYPFEDYQQGLPLSELLWHAAGHERWEHVRHLRKRANQLRMASMMALAKTQNANDSEGKQRRQRQHDTFARKAGLMDTTARDIETSYKAAAIKKITEGPTMLVGFPYPRTTYDHNPICIPKDLFIDPSDKTAIYWDKNEVRGGGLRFQKVRVCQPLKANMASPAQQHAPPQPLSSKPMSQKEHRDTGRPSHKDNIIRMYHCLMRQGKIDPLAQSNVKVFDQVAYETAKELGIKPDQYGNYRGLGHGAIRKALHDRISETRRTSNKF